MAGARRFEMSINGGSSSRRVHSSRTAMAAGARRTGMRGGDMSKKLCRRPIQLRHEGRVKVGIVLGSLLAVLEKEEAFHRLCKEVRDEHQWRELVEKGSFEPSDPEEGSGEGGHCAGIGSLFRFYLLFRCSFSILALNWPLERDCTKRLSSESFFWIKDIFSSQFSLGFDHLLEEGQKWQLVQEGQG
ncbi:hypothetical protein RJ640_030175 [Escallonia rubra]|uniref:Uncharacterized protein n=1 Tax=Escallonia rubra TaxID=112253 RepID=A0AA88QYU3_9ASTE|nr:hypothetical protein RJ640_030175 [Escallonia rubra]